jgi:transcription elongation factor Elf1
VSARLRRHWCAIKRCPFCGSRKVVLAQYKDGSWVVECEGCWSVIFEIPRREWALAKELLLNKKFKEAS